MKVRTFLALLMLAGVTAAYAEQTCNGRLMQETEQCRITFKKCMANPVFSSLCAGQLDNCTKVANQRGMLCTAKEQECMSHLMDRHEICQSNYFECMETPGKRSMCSSDLDHCSSEAEAEAKSCMRAILNFR